jgi:hypothetical protein
MEGEIGAQLSQIKEFLDSLKPEEEMKDPPWSRQQEPQLQTSNLQNCQRINLCFNPLSLWSFIIVAMEKTHTHTYTHTKKTWHTGGEFQYY